MLMNTTAKDAKIGSSIIMDRFPFWRPRKAPRLLVFDTTDPEAPTPASRSPSARWKPFQTGSIKPRTAWSLLEPPIGKTNRMARHSRSARRSIRRMSPRLREGRAFVRPAIDLPGELFAVTELDMTGFLAFTRNFNWRRTGLENQCLRWLRRL